MLVLKCDILGIVMHNAFLAICCQIDSFCLKTGRPIHEIQTSHLQR